jgi:hypothetical protein
MATGCVSDIVPEGGAPVDLGDRIEYTLQMRLPGLSDQAATYATNAATENRIYTLDLLLFTKVATDEIFDRAIRVDLNTLTGTASPYVKTFRTILPKSAVKEYRLVLVANYRDQLDDAAIASFDGKEKEEITGSFNFSTPGKWMATATSQFVMWGESENLTTLTSGTVITMIDLLRAQARIDIGVNLDADNAAQGLPGDLFLLSRVMVHNSYNAGRVVPDAGKYIPVAREVFVPTIPSPTPAVNNKTTMEYILAAPGISYTHEIYVPEYDNLQSDHTTPRPENEHFCLLVAGRYNGSSTDSWYRIDFKNGAQSLDILRNHRYMVNITNVTGPGTTTPDEALVKMPPLTAYVIPWNEQVVDGNPAGDYVFDVSNRNFVFDFLPRTAGYLDNKVTLTTGYYDGWQVDKVTDENDDELTGSDAWLSLSVTQGVANVPATVSVLTTMNRPEQAVRTGYIHVSSGHWNYKIKVTQGYLDENYYEPYESNSYIVSPNTDVLRFRAIAIPVERANESDLGTQINFDDVLSASLVWADKVSGIQRVSERLDAAIADITTIGVGDMGYVLVVPGRQAEIGRASCRERVSRHV